MKKNAFTLIELLGVLLLLAIIALITFPIIDKTLTSAKEEAYNRQKDNIIEAARLYVTENGNYDTNQKQLSFQTLIDAGFLKSGDILDPRDSNKKMPGCILYNWSNSKNQYIYEYSEECSLPTYAVGDLLKVQVSDSETQNIYVLESNGDEIVGLLDRNIGSLVAWISEEDYNDSGGNWSSDNNTIINQNLYKFGPVTANKALEERTSTWNKVSEKYLPSVEDILKFTSFYQNLENKDNWEFKYFEKINTFPSCNNSQDCKEKLIASGYGDMLLPDYMTINLETIEGESKVYAYWLSTTSNINIVSAPYYAWNVFGYGFVYDVGVVYNDFAGIRPVIHISQSNILSKLDSPEYVNPDDVIE